MVLIKWQVTVSRKHLLIVLFLLNFFFWNQISYKYGIPSHANYQASLLCYPLPGHHLVLSSKHHPFLILPPRFHHSFVVHTVVTFLKVAVVTLGSNIHSSNNGLWVVNNSTVSVTPYRVLVRTFHIHAL